MPIFKRGDQVGVERNDGYTTIGTFVRQDDEYIVVEGTVGNNIGHEVVIPKSNITQVVIFKKVREMTDQERTDW